MDLTWLLRQSGALLCALLLVAAVNKLAPRILRRAGFAMPGQSTALTNADLVAFLGVSFLAGFLGAVAIGLLSRPLHLAPVLIYLAIGLVLDGLAVLNTLAGFPAWFKVVFIGSLPVQVWLGVLLGATLH